MRLREREVSAALLFEVAKRSPRGPELDAEQSAGLNFHSAIAAARSALWMQKALLTINGRDRRENVRVVEARTQVSAIVSR
jgi:hypothetical protein